MKPKLVILSSFVEQLMAYGQSRGLDPKVMRAAARVPAGVTLDSESWLPISCSMQLWAHLMRSLDDPGLPIRVARSFRVEDYHAIGFASMVCTTMDELFDRVARYSVFFTNSGTWDFIMDARKITAVWRRDLPLDLGHRVANENTMAEMINFLRQITGQDLCPDRVTLCHPRPKSIRVHEAFFKAPIYFGRASNSLLIPREWMDIPLPKPNPDLATFFESYLRGRVEELDGSVSWSDRVREILLKELPAGAFSARLIAKRLALSERSLRRSLREEGKTFTEIISSVRQERAEYLLTETDLPVSEIAFLLGYSGITAFSRAFRRQTGVSPRKMRAAATMRRALER